MINQVLILKLQNKVSYDVVDQKKIKLKVVLIFFYFSKKKVLKQKKYYDFAKKKTNCLNKGLKLENKRYCHEIQ